MLRTLSREGVRRLPNAHRRRPVYSGFTSKHRTAHSKAKRRTRSTAQNAGLKMRRHNKSIRRCRTKDKPSGFHKPQRKRRSRHGSALRLGRLTDRHNTAGKNLAAFFPRAAACRGSDFSAEKQTEDAAAIRLCMKPHTQGAGCIRRICAGQALRPTGRAFGNAAAAR